MRYGRYVDLTELVIPQPEVEVLKPLAHEKMSTLGVDPSLPRIRGKTDNPYLSQNKVSRNITSVRVPGLVNIHTDKNE